MRALTIQQPYASLIARGDKWVENRGWYCGYRGRLAIHAGKGTDYLDREALALGDYPTGMVLATVDLVACLRFDRLPDPSAAVAPRDLARLAEASIAPIEVRRHPHASGPWCLVLARLRLLREPVAARGMPGLWECRALDTPRLCQRSEGG
jgi:hypothetical protein